MRRFTKKEDKFLWENYTTIPAKRMSKMLGRCESSARQRMIALGIVVPPEIADKFRSLSQYKKGAISFNKGKKQTEFMSAEAIERCKIGRFKKGQPAANRKPLGSLRVCIYGYLEIKIAEPNVWQQYHRLMWEETFGPIPDDKICVFVTKDKMNVHPFNLELIDRVENMKRNSIQNYGAEIANAMQLIGALNRQINKRV